MKNAALLVALAVSFANSPARSGVDALEVETRVSWMTPAHPEVHVLLKNPTNEPIDFSLWLGRGREKRKTICEADLSSIDPNFYRRFDRILGVSRVVTEGIVPANGWTHRSYAVGAAGGIAPCRVPYSLGDGSGAVVNGEIDVPGDQVAGHAVPSSSVALEWQHLVERDCHFPRA